MRVTDSLKLHESDQEKVKVKIQILHKFNIAFIQSS